MTYLYMTVEKKSKFLYKILFLCFFISTTAKSQTNGTIPFKEAIATIEQTFFVKFSYNSTQAENYSLPKPDPALSLDEILNTITKDNQISFSIIDDRYITVVFPEKIITVCASVIDTATGAPAENITIIYNLKEEELSNGGQFQLSDIPDDTVIEIYREGGFLKEIIARQLFLKSSNCPIIFIDENLNFLPTVTLKSYIVKGISKNENGSITITNNEFEILPSLIEPDVLQIAQVLPGVASNDETASNINIRGGKSDETLILWNDIRMYQTGHFFGLISAFNPNLIKRMSVYKNGTHPSYGEGVSGTLAMESVDNITPEFEGGAGINLSSLNGFGKIPISETFGIQVSGRTSINNGVGNPVYKQFFARTFQNTAVTNLNSNESFGVRSTDENFSFFDFSTAVLWDITPKDKLAYHFMAISNKLQFTERFIATDSSQATFNNLRQRTLLGGFNYSRNWNKNLKTTASYNASTYVFEGTNAQNQIINSQSQENKVREKASRLDIRYNITKKIKINGGYQYIETRVTDNNDFIINNSDKTIANSYYGNVTAQLNNTKTTINAGLRWIHYANFDARAEPRISLNHQFTNTFQVYAAAEQKSQTVYQFTARENQILQLENNRWQIADGEENPILKSEQLSAGATFNKNGWTLNLEGYYKQVDGINIQNLGFRNQLQNVSAIGNYTSAGVEFSVSKKLKNFSAWLSYTFMDNELNFPSLTPTTFRGNSDIENALTAATNYQWNNLQFSVGLNYHSGIPYTTPLNSAAISSNNNNDEIEYNEPNNATLEDYFRTDISAKYSFKLDKTFSGNLNISLLNIFDQQTRLSSYYQLSTNPNGENSINRIDQFSLGFTPNISFQLLF